ncbi:hypothetical protein BS47DRAFT_1344464 [Hydnum rufescens UP504]|uniref:Uncharacterized protein n=1 Tax=Hydnum rufescens UP504 TaxID=1448309 RepID=A0A9P6AWI3_9AGAM|nr:hypothetical protein BS47DRAFT_1344464 [Hydnum rufescens UP504]
MYFFAKVLSLFKMSSLGERPVNAWYEQFVTLSREDHARFAAFHLLSIFHWEHRDPDSIIYLRVDRMSIDNDPWTCDDYQASSKALALYSKPSENQNTVESLNKAIDWCRPLDARGTFRYFTDPKSDPPSPTSSARSLGTTYFQNADTQPNILDVIIAVYAVSKLRPNYNAWEANCWWLARSIRRFIQTEWHGEPDGPIPPGVFVDRRRQQLLRDQSGIREIYKELNEALVKNVNLCLAHERAKEEAERADKEAERANKEAERANKEAERADKEAERANEEAEGGRGEAEGRRREAEGRRIAEDRAHAAETRLAELEAQLRLQTLH